MPKSFQMTKMAALFGHKNTLDFFSHWEIQNVPIVTSKLVTRVEQGAIPSSSTLEAWKKGIVPFPNTAQVILSLLLSLPPVPRRMLTFQQHK